MKFRSEIYKDIKEALSEIQELEYIDLQKGQMARSTQNYPLPLPAALVEFKPVAWSNTGDQQLGELVISVYLYVDLVTDSFVGSEAETETFELLDMQDTIAEKIQNLSGDYFSPLQRVADAIHEYGIRYMCFRVDFKTEIQYDSTVLQTEPRPVPKFIT
jgi:hypothetical protein